MNKKFHSQKNIYATSDPEIDAQGSVDAGGMALLEQSK
jgi:hypothetical protein